MKGKEKCKALKDIRRKIAEENDIEIVISECTFQGECKGTCPRCEEELRQLEKELAIRQGLGRVVAVVGVAAAVTAGLTACSVVYEELKEGIEDMWTAGIAPPADYSELGFAPMLEGQEDAVTE